MLIHCGQVMLPSESHDMLSASIKLGIRDDDQSVYCLANKVGEACVKVGNPLCHDRACVDPQAFCRRAQVFPIPHIREIVTIPERADALHMWKSFFEHLKPLL